MSRGIGCQQREILAELAHMNFGAGMLVGEMGGNTRRAAHGLERRGLVTLERMLVWGRWRLVARLARRRF